MDEVAALALPGEHAPAGPPPVASNTRAAVAAYAEAISDGIAAELRRRLFRAIWGEGRHPSSAYEVRRLVTRLMWPQEDIGDRLASPDIPSLLDRDPDLARITRKSDHRYLPAGSGRSLRAPAGAGSAVADIAPADADPTDAVIMWRRWVAHMQLHA